MYIKFIYLVMLELLYAWLEFSSKTVGEATTSPLNGSPSFNLSA